MTRGRGDSRLKSLQVAVDAPQQMDGIDLFAALPDRLATMVICDPQYRTGLDHLKFGNEGSRQKARYKLPQMTDETISFFVEESCRVLKPSGHLALWIDKFAIGQGLHLRYARRTTLGVIDVLAWNKLRMGMGRRLRCTTEYLVLFQKPPQLAKGVWHDHSMLNSWSEMSDPTLHPHAKPYLLTERLIRAATARGDVIIDPCAGSYLTLQACQRTGRRFVGCDLLECPDA